MWQELAGMVLKSRPDSRGVNVPGCNFFQISLKTINRSSASLSFRADFMEAFSKLLRGPTAIWPWGLEQKT